MRPVRINVKEYKVIPNAQITRYRHIQVQVRRVRLFELLQGIGVVSHKIIIGDPDIKKLVPTSLNQWQLAFLALAGILESDDFRKREMNDYRLTVLANTYNSLREDLKTTDSGRSVYEFLIRLSHNQLPLQQSISRMMGRALILFLDIPKTIPNPNIDIEGAVKIIYGMGVEDLQTLGMSLLICSQENASIDREMLRNSTIPEIKEMIKDGRLDEVMSYLTATYEEIRAPYKINPLPKGLEHNTFNTLRLKPIVRSDHGQEIIPITPFLIERTSMGIYYGLMDYFKSKKSNPFLEFFGKEIFERYIGMQLSLFVPVAQLVPEFTYGASNELTSDWIVLDGESAVFIECKTSALTIQAKTYGNLERINDELKLRVIHGIEQMLDLRQKITNKHKGLEKLHHIKNFHFVVTTFDDFYLANAPFVRSMIEKYFMNKGISIDFTYDVMSMNEIESLHEVGKKYSLVDLFRLKHTKQAWIDSDMVFFLKEYLPDKEVELINKENPLLYKRREDYLNYFKQRQAAKQ